MTDTLARSKSEQRQDSQNPPPPQPSTSETAPKLVRVQSLLKFGEQYKASQIKAFEDHYIDYDALKILVYDLFATEAHAKESLHEKRATFFSALIKEIASADNFQAERLRKYYDQHMQILLPEDYQIWKSKQLKRRESFTKLEDLKGTDEKDKEQEKNKNKETETEKDKEKDKEKTTGDKEQTTTTSTDSVKENKHSNNSQTKTNEPHKERSAHGRVATAIRALSRLLIFWKQNELAIINSIKKYEAYAKEEIERHLTIGPSTTTTSSFALRMVPKFAIVEEKSPPPLESGPIGDISKDPKDSKKFKQHVQRLSRAVERFRQRKATTEAEIAKLNDLMHQIAQKEPMPSSDVDLSTFFVEDPVATVKELPIEACDPGTVTRLWLEVGDDPLTSIKVPVIICKGTVKGPVMGITAALHGNEVNGVNAIHRLLRSINVEELTGVIVAIPCANPPGFIHRTRHFICGQETKDLNKCFPGKPDGEGASQFVHCLTQRFVKKITHLIDLHTASHGRQNSLYARADMNHAVCKQMAILQAPQIILHSTAPDGSLREAAMKLGKPAITVEIGNPSSFQKAYILHALQGMENVLSFLGMIHDTVEPPLVMPTICVKSKWSFVEHGGTLQMMVGVNQWLKKGDLIAIGRSIFGDMIKQYMAQEDGIVIGRNIDPTCEMGDRLIHFGTVGSTFPAYNNPFRSDPNAPSQQG